MRYIEIFVTLIMFLSIACGTNPDGRTIDYAGARKVSDSFMADLVANNANDAVGQMEPDFVQTLGRTQAEVQ
ncbi:MAG TPA: hypothetical protein VIH76_16555 [Candidatus Acidoferrales bacterium]